MSWQKKIQQPLKVRPGEWILLAVLILPTVSLVVFMLWHSELAAFMAAMGVDLLAIVALHGYRTRYSDASGTSDP